MASSKLTAGCCSENIELSEPSGTGVSADAVLVFQALAEGLQVVLAEASLEV